MTGQGHLDPYQRRILDDILDELLTGLPAIVLQGPKGVGKTATGERRADDVLSLDDRLARESFQASNASLEHYEGTLLIDEWQLEPDSWNSVRRAVDRGAQPGAYLLAGSSAPPDSTIHSGAGRIYPLRMRPLSLAERDIATPSVSLKELLRGDRPDLAGRTSVDLAQYVDEILSTGLPGIRPLPEVARRRQIDGYVEWVVHKEFGEQGVVVRRPRTLKEWLAAYAAATGTTTSYNRVLEAATPALQEKPARATTTLYRDVLSRAFLLDPLEAWIPTMNHMSRLASSPKHFLLDPGIAARILGANKNSLLRGRSSGPQIPRDGTLLGALFEHLVVLSTQTYAQAADARVSHLRLHNGRHEVDLIVERDQTYVAIEVKLTPSVKDEDVRHLHWLKEQLGDDLVDAIVVTTGPEAYRRQDGIGIVPAALLGP
jgi:hypothetical protein